MACTCDTFFLTRHRRASGCEYTYEDHPYGNYFVLEKTFGKSLIFQNHNNPMMQGFKILYVAL